MKMKNYYNMRIENHENMRILKFEFSALKNKIFVNS